MISIHIGAENFPNATTLYIWEFSDGSSGNVTDTVASKVVTLTGTMTQEDNHLDTPVSVYCGMPGADYFTSTDAVFLFTGDFSAGGWAFCNWAVVSGRIVMCANNNGTEGWALHTSTSQLFLTIGDGVEANNVVSHGLSDSSWHHFACTFNGTSKAYVLYIDGADVASGTSAKDYVVGDTLSIGAESDGGGDFIGRVQDVFVHNNTILSAGQMARIFNGTIPGSGGLPLFDF